MNTQTLALRTAVAVALVLPGSISVAQYTGTSHPEEVPVTTSNDGMRQPVVYMSATQQVPGQPISPASASFVLSVSNVPAQGPSAATTSLSGETGQPRATSFEEDRRTNREVDGSIVTHVTGPANSLPTGTLVKTKLLQDLFTRTTREGTEWHAELVEPLVRDGHVIIPAGSMLHGRVTEVHGGRRISGEASMHLQCLSLVLPDGTSRGIHAQVIDTSLYHETKVDREGTILRRDHRKEEGGVLALTAGSGAAAGGVLGGVPGAVVGASLGAGVSAALWLRQDRQVQLPHNTEITLELTKPLLSSFE